MGVLDGLKPGAVFRSFEELTRIPHGSGNTKAISDFVADRARSHGHTVLQDAEGNLLVTIPATPGREALAPLVLQGHLDMVAVRSEDSTVDPATDPLKLLLSGDILEADGTTLGGDDGIAIAYFMALMEEKEHPHPTLYLLMTTDEETGMDGARALDPSWLKSRYFINIDSEDEGVFLAGCAGGGRVHMKLSCGLSPAPGRTLTLQIGGLKGGHSGQDIIEHRGNACHILGKLLTELMRPAHGKDQIPMQLRIAGITGGVADNAIPSAASCILAGVSPEDEERIRRVAAAFAVNWGLFLQDTDPGLTVSVVSGTASSGGLSGLSGGAGETAGAGESDPPTALAADPSFTGQLAELLKALPDGVQAMSGDMPRLVQTSLNLGILRFEQTEEGAVLHLDLSVRSSVTDERDALIKKIYAIAQDFGAVCDTHGLYPGWQYDPDSVIIRHFSEVYRHTTGKEARVEAIHAGVECGLFKEKRSDLDCISFGPDLENVHSVNEKLHIGSAVRTWELLLAVLESWQTEAEA